MKEYNGHRSWNSWAVHLEVFNDSWVYSNFAETIEKNRLRSDDKKLADNRSINQLCESYCGQKTSDGGVYNRLNIRKIVEEWS